MATFALIHGAGDVMRGVVAERLGVVPVELAAGHCAALSRPVALSEIFAGAPRE